MSTQRYTPEFKEEAIRQVVKRAYPVPEVAPRLRESVHNVHKYVYKNKYVYQNQKLPSEQ